MNPVQPLEELPQDRIWLAHDALDRRNDILHSGLYAVDADAAREMWELGMLLWQPVAGRA